MVQLKWGAVSVTGNFRENNEDAYTIQPEGNYFLVADGMGGQSAGEKASALAIELIPQKLDASLDVANSDAQTTVAIIDDAVEYANSEIIALSQLDPRFHNMGTTIAFLVRAGEKLYAGGIGDSRVYLLRHGQWKQLTTDHSLTQALVEAKTITEGKAVNPRSRNVLYRSLGTKDGSNGTDPVEIEPQSGERFLICSDGVTDGLDDTELAELLQQDADAQQTAQRIVDAAEAGGSRDNITCIVVIAD